MVATYCGLEHFYCKVLVCHCFDCRVLGCHCWDCRVLGCHFWDWRVLGCHCWDWRNGGFRTFSHKLSLPWLARLGRGCLGVVLVWLPHMQGGWLACWRLQDRIPAVAEPHRFILCTRRSGGTAHDGGGCDQSIGSTVSEVIVRSWLWSTATRSSPLGYSSRLLQVVDNWPHILWW